MRSTWASDLDRIDHALLLADPAHEDERVVAFRLEWRAVKGQAVVDDARPRDLGMHGCLVAADGDEAERGIGQDGTGERSVEPAMEGPHGRGRAGMRQEHTREVEMPMDDVEGRGATQDLGDRGEHETARIAVVARAPQGTWDGRDELARDVRISAREDRHRVAPSIELDGQLVHDPLGPAIGDGRHRLGRWGDEGDAQSPGSRIAGGRSLVGSVRHRAPSFGGIGRVDGMVLHVAHDGRVAASTE